MKTIITLLFLSFSAFGADLSELYQANYGQSLTQAELQKLANTEIVLIPGIGSETFIWEDTRGVLDLSLLFKNSFGAQLSHYRKLGLPTRRLWASSYSVQETIEEIAMTVEEIRSKNKKVLFISHSLGGLALLDYLASQTDFSHIQGILFLQSPFYGSPIASIYFKNPYFASSLLGPMLPYLNASEDSVEYLSLENRNKVMEKKKVEIQNALSSIPAITLGTTTLGHKSLMEPAVNIIGHGCLVLFRGKCRSRKLFEGPYSNSDGMVPLESSKLPGIDHIVVDRVDHGETMQAMPYKNIDRVKLTDAALKILLNR
jgi:triacylglycerol lipase